MTTTSTKQLLPARTKFLNESTKFVKAFTKSTQTPDPAEQDEFAQEALKICLVAVAGSVPAFGSILAPITELIVTYCQTNAAKFEKDYKEVIQDLIDSSIAIYDNSKLTGYYSSYLDIYKKFKKAVQLLKSTGQDSAGDVPGYWRQMDTYLGTCITNSKTAGLEVAELHMHTLFVTLRLLINREKYVHGIEWGWDQPSIDQVLIDMRDIVKTATQHSKSTYDLGLGKILKGKGYTDQLLGCEVDYHNQCNAYRNHMIYMVFDYVAIWPTYLPDTYPNWANMERVRYLFGNVGGVPIDPNMADPSNSSYYKISASRIQELLLAKQCYQGPLQSIQLFRQKNGNVNNRFVAIQSTGLNVFGNTNIVTSGDNYDKIGVTATIDSKPHDVNLEYDVVPRHVSIDSSILDVSVSDVDREMNKGQTAEWDFYYQFSGNSILYKPDNRRRVAFPYSGDHKIEQSFNLGSLNTNLISTDPEHTHGFLSNITFGYQSVGVFPENCIYHNITNFIDAQKCVFNDKAVFSMDKFAPGIHAMYMPYGSNLGYYTIRGKLGQPVRNYIISLQFETKPETTFYKIKVAFGEYNTPTDTFYVQGTSAVTEPTIKQAKIITKTTDLDNFVKLDKVKENNLINIVVESGDIYLYNVIVTPAKLAA